MNRHTKVRQLAIAVYTVNRHAKTAPNNKELYDLKKMALEKLLRTGDAKKLGLHFVENPKFSKQHSTTLVQCLDFLFHMVPDKEDFKILPHLGHQNHSSRNPQERMSLRVAKELLYNFIDMKPISKQRTPKQRTYKKIANSKGFRSSYLDG